MENNRMGEFLAALRKSKGYTQQEVADTLGVSNKTVSSWETGASCPDISMLPVLAELYGVTCDEIIRGKRLSGEEELSPAGRKKAMEHLLQRQKTNLFTLCWIAGGLTGVALFLTSLIGFAALESLIGFFVGLIFQAASIITTVICIRRLRFQAAEGGTIDLQLAMNAFGVSPKNKLLGIAVERAQIKVEPLRQSCPRFPDAVGEGLPPGLTIEIKQQQFIPTDKMALDAALHGLLHQTGQIGQDLAGQDQVTGKQSAKGGGIHGGEQTRRHSCNGGAEGILA